MIEVSCAIILRDNRVLAVQRGPETDHPFQWEFPGGKVRSNESAEESIGREIIEELSVEIEIIEKLESVEYDYLIKQIRLIPFACRILNRNVKLTEHIDMQWIFPGDMDKLNWSEADRKLIENNRNFFKRLSEI